MESDGFAKIKDNSGLQMGVHSIFKGFAQTYGTNYLETPSLKW